MMEASKNVYGSCHHKYSVMHQPQVELDTEDLEVAIFGNCVKAVWRSMG